MNPRVEQTIEKVEAMMAGVDDALALPREAVRFVHGLVLACGARRVVEIGTSYGYSGLWIAAALAETGGKLITIDRDARKSRRACEHFAAAGLGERVEVRTGLAADVLAEIEGPVDFVLNDADKENCRSYVEILLDRLDGGAVVLTDNTITHADALGPFMAWIREHEAFASVEVPIGNGMELSVRRRGLA